MDSLPIPLLLPIKHRIFILRSHLRLRRHLLLPPLQLGCRLHVLLLEGIVDGLNYVVHKTKAFALTALLGGGETPGYFPVRERLLVGHEITSGLWMGMGRYVPEEASGERGSYPKGTEHDSKVAEMDAQSYERDSRSWHK